MKKLQELFRTSFPVRVSVWVVLAAALIFMLTQSYVYFVSKRSVWDEAVKRATQVLENSELRLTRILDDVEKTAAILRDAGYILSITPVIAVEVPNEPGGLRRTLRTLSEVNVNVEYMYAFVGSNPAVAMMVFRVADIEKAVTALESAGIREVTL